MRSDDESIDRVLVGCAASLETGACPDASVVAGFAEGRLSEAESDLVAAHAAGCAACRSGIIALAGAGLDGDTAAIEPMRGPRPGFRLLGVPRRVAIAAAALVAIGVGALVIARSRGAETPSDTDGRLTAAAFDLASAEPALFEGFVPLSRSERASASDGRERGGLRLLGPTDVILSGRPTFRWMPVPGALRYDVSLAHEGSGAIGTWTASGAELVYPSELPALEPGSRYVWKVAMDGVLGGRTESRRTFIVASVTEAETFARAKRAITERVPLDIRSLLGAHWALRHGLVDEAERLARDHLGRDRDGAAGRETLRAILRRRGAPEGDDTTSPEKPPR